MSPLWGGAPGAAADVTGRDYHEPLMSLDTTTMALDMTTTMWGESLGADDDDYGELTGGPSWIKGCLDS